MKKLILASTSPRRKELLASTGLSFEIIASSYEEDMALNLPPAELVVHLSQSKAGAVAGTVRNTVVLGADTIVVYQNKVLGKPHTNERAKEMLQLLSGQEHSVFTGFTVIDVDSGKSFSKAVETKLKVKNLTEQEIDEYVATGEPLDKAGARAVQDLGGKLFESIKVTSIVSSAYRSRKSSKRSKISGLQFESTELYALMSNNIWQMNRDLIIFLWGPGTRL